MKGQFVVETAEVIVRIKRAVVDGLMDGKSKDAVVKSVNPFIKKYIVAFKNVEERKERQKELIFYTVKLYDKLKRRFEGLAGAIGVSVAMVIGAFKGEKKAVERIESIAKGKFAVVQKTAPSVNLGLEREYIFADRIDIQDLRKKVKSAILEIGGATAGNIRSRAEAYARHQAQEESITQMKDKGVKLVWCSTHQDCSVRCAPWQGKLYSLDGTSGEIDGNRYQPLERATDIYYTTKAGKTYKNGLLGFNCRHRLVPYNKNQTPPKMFTERQMEKMRAIDRVQRQMELEIRKVKEKAFTIENQDKVMANRLFAKARKMVEAYRDYCYNNDRVAMIFRTQITREEIGKLRR